MSLVGITFFEVAISPFSRFPIPSADRLSALFFLSHSIQSVGHGPRLFARGQIRGPNLLARGRTILIVEPQHERVRGEVGRSLSFIRQ